MNRKVRSFKSLLSLSILSLSLVALSVLPGGQVGPLRAEPGRTGAYELQEAFHRIYDENRSSVVFISTERTVQQQGANNDPFFEYFFGNRSPKEETRKSQAMGTGFILTADGFVCTNYHVVEKADKIHVRLDKKDIPAKLVGSDPLTDIALLKLSGVSDLKPVRLGDSDGVRVGDWAIAIGNPFGLDRTFTVGVISAVARRGLDDLGNDHFQTDASINPGNSGGPLLNLEGEVIGMNRMIVSQSGGNVGIGFAIPANRVKDIVEQLRMHGRIRRGFVGVRIVDLTPELARQVKSPVDTGVFVVAVMKNGPAAKAGLKPGDVIVSVGGKPVREPDEVIRIVTAAGAGSTLPFVLYREGKTLTVQLLVGERPNQ